MFGGSLRGSVISPFSTRKRNDGDSLVKPSLISQHGDTPIQIQENELRVEDTSRLSQYRDITRTATYSKRSSLDGTIKSRNTGRGITAMNQTTNTFLDKVGSTDVDNELMATRQNEADLNASLFSASVHHHHQAMTPRSYRHDSLSFD